MQTDLFYLKFVLFHLPKKNYTPTNSMESHLKSLILKNQRMRDLKKEEVKKKNYILEKDLKLRLLMKNKLKNKGININQMVLNLQNFRRI